VITRNPLIKRVRGLYLITDHGEHLIERVSEALPHAGVLQFRSKGHAPSEKIRLGRELRELCLRSGKLFIVNDDPRLALELDADGVHLGQDDGAPAEARRIIGEGKLIGISTHSPEEALAAEDAGADYIGFGAMFPTASKDITRLAGVESLAETRKKISVPIVAIGGIGRKNAASVLGAGADAIAVISAVMSHREPSLAAEELHLLFNRRKALPRGSVLTVAGSDSGGGAGIQADLKTITLLGSYGTSAVTALTAQNTLGVTGIHPVPPGFVAAQLDAVLSDIPIDVVKTGMLFSADIIHAVADRISSFGKRILVVDPVMIAKGGANLLASDAVDALKKSLLPLTYLLTPNIPEAEALAGMRIVGEADMERAVRTLHAMGCRNVLLKGGHLPGDEAIDLLFDGDSMTRFSSPRIDSVNTHGTGCTLSSAVAAFLAQGEPLPIAIGLAKEFISTAIRHSGPLGKGHGPVNHFRAAAEFSSRAPSGKSS
jgi:hydroxymethylpyrimidine kinase/phosphomethylpyrimidine kinase/thiamine-phosphate diphosphorylase